MITGHKIKFARQIKNISPKAMASELNIDDSTYLRLERGETKLTEERIQQILNKLGVKREYLEQLSDTVDYNNTNNDNGSFVNAHQYYESINDKTQFKTTEQTLQLVVELIQNQNKLMEKIIEIISK